jgi:hypothetical protein
VPIRFRPVELRRTPNSSNACDESGGLKQTPAPNEPLVPSKPVEYAAELGMTICDRLVEDESLRSICAEPEMPAVATVSSWISNNGEFRDMYAFAREFQAHCILDETIVLIDEVGTEWVEKVRANGRVVRGPDRKKLPRCRLRIKVRHWVAEGLLARARQLSGRTLS